MGEAFIVRKGGVTSETTAAPTITIVSETTTGVTFTVTNNDDNTALITHEVDDNIGAVELAAAATSSNITVALAAGTYTLSAFATVVGEVATSATVSVEIVVPEYEELFSTTVATAVTEIDITSLSIGKDDTVRLVYTFVGDSSSVTGTYFLLANGNNTLTSYHEQELGGNGTGFIVNRRNEPRFALARSNENAEGNVDIKVSNNDKFVAQTHFSRRVGAEAASITNENHNIVGSGFTLTSITSLRISCDRTNGIAVGSKIALYKVTEAA